MVRIGWNVRNRVHNTSYTATADLILRMSIDQTHSLPQDPPTRQLSIHESSGTSLTDSEFVSRGSRSRTRSRSSREIGIYGEITYGIRKLQAQLQDEKRRADGAERKLAEVTTHLKTVNEARLVAMQDAAQAKEDIRLDPFAF